MATRVMLTLSVLLLPASTLVCQRSSSNSIDVTWNAVNSTDLYMIEMATNRTSLPFLVQTTTATTASIADLLVNTSYCFNIRSHIASAPSIVWHWRARNSSLAVCCETAHDGLKPHSIQLQSSNGFRLLTWQLATPVSQPPRLQLTHLASSTRTLMGSSHITQHQLSNLKAGSAYSLRVVDGTRLSDPFYFQTPALNSTFTTVYRVSEYTNEVDLLVNHDSASLEGQAAFLTNTNSALFFNVSLNPPVTRYCVEHAAASWAPYVSCNGPEADPRNHPEDPLCICDVWADRMIALQSKQTFDKACDPIVWASDGSHNDPFCNCSDGLGNWSKWVTSQQSKQYLGRNAVWLPFFYYQVPASSYPGQTPFGYFYSHPKESACQTSLSEPGCSWLRQPTAHVVRGNDLLHGGWNATSVAHWPLHTHGPNTTAEVLSNLPVFKQAWYNVDSLTLSRCCGC